MSISQASIVHSDGSVDIAVVVPFIPPALPGSCKASKPIIDQITATVATTGGTLTGGQSVYYHFTAVDSLGVESIPSEPIEVVIPAGTNTNKVTLQAVNSPFDSSTSTFNVYRSKVAPTGDGTPANNPQQASSGNTPPASCASLTLTDTGSSISGGGGGAGSGNPPPSQLYIKTRVYYQLPSESIWRLGAETNDASQTSLQFHLPHNIQGQQINVQLRNVFRNGYETPAGLAPVASYTIAAAYPSALGIGAAPPAGSSFGVNGAKIIDNSGNTGADSLLDGANFVRLRATHASGNVAYNFKGAWSSATSYVVADEVTFGNIYWIALAANSNSQPSISNANWQAVGRIQGDVQIFTSSGTWSKPAAGTFAVITCIGGGGGGASGDAAFNNGTNENGGGGGGAGGFSSQILPLSVLGATESVSIGGGGGGGAAITQSVAGETAGNNGNPGGTSSFGNWLRATGGGAGVEGQVTGVSGTGNIAAGGLSMFPGAGGAGGNALSNSTATAGTNGGNGASARVTSYGGGSGTAGSTGTSSSNANPGTNASTDEPAGGGGGGGAGGCSRIAGTLVAGNGGNGGNYGAGGGGGGAAANNGTSGSAKSGAGGNGAPGIVIVSVF